MNPPNQTRGAPAVPAFAAAGNLIYRSETVPVFVKAHGCYLTDSDGRRYLDLEAANGTLPFGYDAGILEAAASRARALPALPSFCESRDRLDLLQRLQKLVSDCAGTPGRVDLDLGGAQAVEAALRIAVANNGPGTILVFQGAFHGRSPVTSMLSSSPRYRELLAAWGLEVVRLPSPDCSRCPHHRANQIAACTQGCIAAATQWGTETSGVGGVNHHRRVCAVVLEPVLNVGGMVEPDHTLLRSLASYAKAQGALVILDEIFTGMHRIGPRWGFERAGIVPDLVVASKGLTNGAAAASMVWAREPLADPAVYRPGSHSSTYAGIPASIAVIATVLDRWDAWTSIESDLHHYQSQLTSICAQLTSAHPDVIVDARSVGATCRLQLRGPLAEHLRTLARHVHPHLGVLVASTGMATDVINIHPPLIMAARQFSEMYDVLDTALRRLGDHTNGRVADASEPTS